MDENGKIVWRLLFGVVMAGLLMGILITYTYTQRQFAEEKEAQNIADDLSKTAFSAINRQERSVELPSQVGDSLYTLEVNEDKNEFQIQISDSGGGNKTFHSTPGVKLEKKGEIPDPGEEIYFKGDGDKVFFSENPIEELPSEAEENETEYEIPDNFYEKNKSNPELTTGLIHAYFYARDKIGPDIDIEGYKWNGSDELFVKTSEEIYLLEQNVDNIDGFTVKEWGNIETAGSVSDDEFAEPNYSIRKAYESGYIYSPEEAKSSITRRTWQDIHRNIVELSNIQFDGDIKAATIDTDVSTFSTWRMEFEDYTFYYGTMPWKPGDSDPGFTFYSPDHLEVV